MSRRSYPNHGRPVWLSPTGGDSHSVSSYSEQGLLFNDAPGHPHLNSTLFLFWDTTSTGNNFPNTYPTAQRSTPVPYEPPYYPPAQRQQTHATHPTYPSYQQLSEAKYHSGQAHDGSYNHTGDPIYRGTTYSRTPSTSLSLVPYNVPPKIQGSTIKKRRKRANARQLEALNRVYARTAFPSSEEREQLVRELDMSARSVQIWFQNKRQASRQGGRKPVNSSVGQTTVTLPEDTPPVIIHPRGSPALMSRMDEPSCPSRSPPPAIRGRPHAEPDNMDPRGPVADINSHSARGLP